MPLPPDLLHAISDPDGGGVVLVIGAGTSMESPTNLPSARDCSLDAHRKLIADGVLGDGDCVDPEDLSCLADAVYEKSARRQHELVERLPRRRFRFASPNQGCMLAAALLREQAVQCVMTLNFDLGMTTALANVGAADDVAVIDGPENHDQWGVANLIYLHRNVDADSERWVLRTKALEEEWRDAWEDMIARRVIGAPVTVFAGLGTPAGVLIETTKRVRELVEDRTRIYQVDPADRDGSAFAEALDLPDDAYLQLGWGRFMADLTQRLATAHCSRLCLACRELIAAQSWDDGDPTELCDRLAEVGLLALGELRASWLLDDSGYLPDQGNAILGLLADLLLAIGLIESGTGARAFFAEDGIVEFHRADGVFTSVVVASGRGVQRWSSLEATELTNPAGCRRRHREPRFVLCSGVLGRPPEDLAPPIRLIDEEDPEDIVSAGTTLTAVSVDQLRASPELAKAIVA